MLNISPYPWIAAFGFALLLAGFLFRKRDRRLHAALMSAGMALDLGLVLILEFSKNAIGTVFHEKLNVWQQLHVGTATFAVALYIPIFALGCLRLFRPELDRSGIAKYWHIRLGICALVSRSASFLFMFSMLGRSN